MAINLSEYKTLYVSTAHDLIRTLQNSFEALQKDMCDKKAIEEFHRAAHSLKSQSLVMGYTKTGLASKMLEHLFAAIKENKTCLDAQIMPVIKTTMEKIHESVNAISAGQDEIAIDNEMEALSKAAAIPLM